jgi:hypothetical protein
MQIDEISERDFQVLLNVRGYFGSNALHWHKAAVLSSQIGVGAAAAIAGAAITVKDSALSVFAFALCVLVAFFSRFQAIHASEEFNRALAVLVKVDWATAVFEKGKFGLSELDFLYPAEYFFRPGDKPPEDAYLKRNTVLAFWAPFLIGCVPILVSLDLAALIGGRLL